MSRYFIAEGKIRLLQKTGAKRSLKIVINDPPQPFALFDSKKRLLTLMPNRTSANQVDEAGQWFVQRKDGEGDLIPFDKLYFGAISVKRYIYAHNNKEVVVDERLVPTNIKVHVHRVTRALSDIQIEVLRFIGGRLHT